MKQISIHAIRAVILVLFTSTILCGQNAKKVFPIEDLRNKGVYKDDFKTKGHHDGELNVKRVSDVSPGSKEASSAYLFYFYKKLNNKLCYYSAFLNIEKDYDKASYTWDNDTIVTVSLINSKTNKAKELKLFNPKCKGCSAGIVGDSLKGLLSD